MIIIAIIIAIIIILVQLKLQGIQILFNVESINNIIDAVYNK